MLKQQNTKILNLLQQSPLFRGMQLSQIQQLLTLLGGVVQSVGKGQVIMPQGQVAQHMGVVLQGLVVIGHSDAWGNHTVLGSAAPGEAFAEAYAVQRQQPMLVCVTAAEDSQVLLLQPPSAGDSTQLPLLQHFSANLLQVCAAKSLQLSERIVHTAPKGIRRRLLSYFSGCAQQAGRNQFDIPFTRQQLADYLGVDRSAMCSEMSKMQREGLIVYRKNHIALVHPGK